MDKNDKNNKSNDLGFYYIFISGKTLFYFLLRKWWIIMAVGFSGAILGYFTAYLDKAKYESYLTFSLEDGQGGVSGALSLAADFGFSIGSGNNLFEGDNILTLLTSRRILERVLLSVDSLDGKPITMADYFIKVTTAPETKKEQEKLSAKQLRLRAISFPAGQPRSSFSYLQDSILMNLYKQFAFGGSLRVGRPDKKLNLYDISIISPEERFTKVFTDKLINEATSFYIELKTKKAKETLRILEDRVSNTKGALNSAIGSRANIQDANLNPAFQEAAAQLQKKQVDISAYGGAYGELYKNLELARYQYLKDIPLLQIIDGADYPMNRIKKSKTKTAIIYAFIFSLITIVIFLIIRQLRLYKSLATEAI